MLQRDEDRHHLFFVFRPVKIHAVLIVQREHLLGKDGNDPAFGVVKLEVQPQNVAPELPAQALDIGDVLDQAIPKRKKRSDAGKKRKTSSKSKSKSSKKSPAADTKNK